YKFRLALGAGVVGDNPGWWHVMHAAVRQRLGSAEGWVTTFGGLAVAAAGALLWMTDVLETLEGLGFLGGGIGASIGAALLRVKGIIRQPFSVDLDESASRGGQASYTPAVGEDIDRLVHLVAPGEDEALVIFVDDLDRCSPDRVKDAVEAINLLFNNSASSRTVFVLGMDVDMVAASLSVAYRPIIGELRRRESEAAGDFGFRFLGKIVQLSFTIPGPREPELDSFLNELIGTVNAPTPSGDGNGRDRTNAAETSPAADGEAVPKAAMSPARREAVQERVRQEAEGMGGATTGVSNLLDAAEEVAEDADESEREEVEEAALDYARRENLRWLRNDAPAVQQAIRYGAPILPPRPRDYKRFVNAVRLQFLVANQSYRHGHATAAPEQIGKWTALGMRWPVLAEEIRKRPSLLGELEEWADGESVNPPEAALWPGRVLQLLADPGLRPALRQPPKLRTTELHGMLSVH
ncbi:MAG: P-loop NTPase fold protein, partial [Chloroflexota bacterium]